MKLCCFNGRDAVALFDKVTSRFAIVQLNGPEKLKMALITERHNLWNWLHDFPNFALIGTEFLSLHDD